MLIHLFDEIRRMVDMQHSVSACPKIVDETNSWNNTHY